MTEFMTHIQHPREGQNNQIKIKSKIKTFFSLHSVSTMTSISFLLNVEEINAALYKRSLTHCIPIVSQLGLVVRHSAGKRKDASPDLSLHKLWFMDTVL